MSTGTFTFMPADKNWIYHPTRNPYYNCPAHHQFEVNLVSRRLEISGVELTYDDTSNDMIIDGHTLPCYFSDGFCKPTTKTPFTLVWFHDDYCLVLTLQDFIGRMTKIEDRYWIETYSFVHSPHSIKPKTTSGIKGTEHPYVYAPHTQHLNNPSLSRFEVFPAAQTFVVNQTHFILHNIQTFLLHTLMVSICIHNPILTLGMMNIFLAK